jgi:hypothetical protein
VLRISRSDGSAELGKQFLQSNRINRQSRCPSKLLGIHLFAREEAPKHGFEILGSWLVQK